MTKLRPGPYECKRKDAQTDDKGNPLVWATHPDMPNLSGNARGRVIHIERQDEKFSYPSTFCGMKAVEYAGQFHNRRICIPCVQLRDREGRP